MREIDQAVKRIAGRHLTLQRLLERKFGPQTPDLALKLLKLRSEELEGFDADDS